MTVIASLASNFAGKASLWSHICIHSRCCLRDDELEQVMPRAKARAMPASKGFSAGPAKLKNPNRPPQPTNPIFDPEGCKAYIVYTCNVPPARARYDTPTLAAAHVLVEAHAPIAIQLVCVLPPDGD